MNTYTVKVEFDDDEKGVYEVADSTVTYTKVPNEMTMAEVTAVNQTISYLMPLLRRAKIKKLEIELL